MPTHQERNPAANRDEVHRRVLQLAPHLRRLAVRSLDLFGAVSGGTPTQESDVDLVVEFSGPTTFDAYMELREMLERALGRPVDLVTRKAFKPRVARMAEMHRLYAT